MRLLTFLAKRFVAGDTMKEAAAVVDRLNQNGLSATLDVLGENVSDKYGAIKAKDSYLDLLDLINSKKLNSNVSLKLTQMGMDIGREFCSENLRSIVERAKAYDNFVRVDMEGSLYTQKTIDIFNSVYKDYRGHVGIVIQAYLFRSEEDINFLNNINAPVRLCKGAYNESPSIAFKNMGSIRKNFMELTARLMSNGGYHALATHDPYLIEKVREYARNSGISKEKYEFQMLYGIKRKLSKKMADEGYRVRIYVPFGTHWLPYTLRRLRERKENVFFVLKNLFTD